MDRWTDGQMDSQMQQELQERMWQERIQPEQRIRNNRLDAAAADRPDRQADR